MHAQLCVMKAKWIMCVFIIINEHIAFIRLIAFIVCRSNRLSLLHIPLVRSWPLFTMLVAVAYVRVSHFLYHVGFVVIVFLPQTLTLWCERKKHIHLLPLWLADRKNAIAAYPICSSISTRSTEKQLSIFLSFETCICRCQEVRFHLIWIVCRSNSEIVAVSSFLFTCSENVFRIHFQMFARRNYYFLLKIRYNLVIVAWRLVDATQSASRTIARLEPVENGQKKNGRPKECSSFVDELKRWAFDDWRMVTTMTMIKVNKVRLRRVNAWVDFICSIAHHHIICFQIVILRYSIEH